MKKFLKVVGILVLVLIVAFLVTGLIVPKTYHMERDVTINASREKVWTYIASFPESNKWDPFSKKDPNIHITFMGPQGAVGSAYKWSGNKDVGEGEQTLTKIDPQNGVETALHFIKPVDARGESYIKLAENAPTTTKVTWGVNIHSSYPWNAMNLLMDAGMKKEFDKGLNNLKGLCEKNL